jgi:tetratricopeptide (TPR) repeat protein
LRNVSRAISPGRLALCLFFLMTANYITVEDSSAQSTTASASAPKQGAVSKSKDFSSAGNVAPSSAESSSNAMQYFDAKQYEKAADAFDIVLKTSAPARLTYYAALSNQSAGRTARATALFQFVVTNFPNTTEAKYSQTALTNGSLNKPNSKIAGNAPVQQKSTPDGSIEQLMEKTKAQLPKDMQAKLETPEGQIALREMAMTALKNQKNTTDSPPTTASLRRMSTSNSDQPSAASTSSKLDNSFIQIAEKTQYSEQVRRQILQALALIPEGVKNSLFAGGTRIIIDSDSSNMGSDPGFDAAGMFVSRENAVHVAERASTRVLVAYTSEVVLHEMGHAFDQGKSSSSPYKEAYQDECDKLNANDTKTLSYYVTTDFGGRPAKECFAELFKIICETGTEQSRTGGYAARDRVLARHFPNTLAVVKDLLK